MINEEEWTVIEEGSLGTMDRPTLPIDVVDSLETLYELGHTIGRGEFAKVKLARCRQTLQLVAIKIIMMDDVKGNRLLREISILSRLKHPNIIKLLRILRLADRIAMVMEYASGGEVFDHVQSKGHLPETEVRIVMKQLISAVEYMHGFGIVHRDLKLENLLRMEDGRVVITDFGFATQINGDSKDKNLLLHTACGSPCYAAPELVLDKKGYQGRPVDLWSCGVIMYAMAYGYLPFESDLHLEHSANDVLWTPTNVYQLYQHISSQPLKLPSITPIDGLGPDGQDLLLQLLTANPMARITVDQIRKHPWMMGE